MSLTSDFAELKRMPTPVVRTNDAAALWATSPATASTMLARLAKVGHIQRLVRGLWLLDPTVHPWSLHPYLTDPSPSYLSLQTALFHYGMIEQIPTTIHVISTAKSRTIKTAVGTYCIHQVAPNFFTDFQHLSNGPAQIATPEKSLVDFFYFRPTKSRSFRNLPELELSKGFSKKHARDLASLIASNPRRIMVEKLLSKL
jgi:predicted transcriptional regulator of viral defense system